MFFCRKNADFKTTLPRQLHVLAFLRCGSGDLDGPLLRRKQKLDKKLIALLDLPPTQDASVTTRMTLNLNIFCPKDISSRVFLKFVGISYHAFQSTIFHTYIVSMGTHSIRISSIRIHSIRIDSIRIHSIRIDSIRIHSRPIDSMHILSIPIDVIRSHSTPFHSQRMQSIRIDSRCINSIIRIASAGMSMNVSKKAFPWISLHQQEWQ